MTCSNNDSLFILVSFFSKELDQKLIKAITYLKRKRKRKRKISSFLFFTFFPIGKGLKYSKIQ